MRGARRGARERTCFWRRCYFGLERPSTNKGNIRLWRSGGRGLNTKDLLTLTHSHTHARTHTHAHTRTLPHTILELSCVRLMSLTNIVFLPWSGCTGVEAWVCAVHLSMNIEGSIKLRDGCCCCCCCCCYCATLTVSFLNLDWF